MKYYTRVNNNYKMIKRTVVFDKRFKPQVFLARKLPRRLPDMASAANELDKTSTANELDNTSANEPDKTLADSEPHTTSAANESAETSAANEPDKTSAINETKSAVEEDEVEATPSGSLTHTVYLLGIRYGRWDEAVFEIEVARLGSLYELLMLLPMLLVLLLLLL